MMIQEVEDALLYWVMVKVLPLIWPPLTPPRRKSSVSLLLGGGGGHPTWPPLIP